MEDEALAAYELLLGLSLANTVSHTPSGNMFSAPVKNPKNLHVFFSTPGLKTQQKTQTSCKNSSRGDSISPKVQLRGGGIAQGARFTRIQFPVRLSFVNTINKAQGQTLARVSLIFTGGEECFAHGQLYVALSRVRNERRIMFFCDGTERLDRADVAKNIVHRELI
uniref:ATP-dependent DNA helicase n=1 Tax=Steinernema glaseri TaxID=37863 RepID=A0A1I7ZUP6_9BILA